jgi:hypothetical protein
VNLVPIDLNQDLAKATLNRIAAENAFIKGKSAFWRATGIGAIGLGLGASIGIILFGYSFIRRSSDNLDNLSLVFSKALSDARLHGSATGIVSVEPHEIVLAQGQTVTIDSSSRVAIEPNAKVVADGELRVQAPSISPMPSKQTSARTESTVANFTIFKSVPFEKGTIMTGWKFLTTAQKLPTAQYCYYTESSDGPGLDVVVSVANDMKLEPPKTVPKDFDISAAFEKCVWFKNENL